MGTAHAVSCILLDGQSDVSISILPHSPVGFILTAEFTQDNVNFTTISANLLLDMATGSTAALSASGGVWTAELPGPGWIRVYAAAVTSGSVDVEIAAGSALANSVGQAPALLQDYYLVQTSGASQSYSCSAGDALGNVKVLTISIASLPVGGPDASDNLVARLNAAFGPNPPSWVWAVLFEIPVETSKYVGAAADYAGSSGSVKPYPSGSTLEAGPVPIEFLSTLSAIVASDGSLQTGIFDADGDRANVQTAGDTGWAGIVAYPAPSTSSTSLGSAGTFDFPAGVWASFVLTLKSGSGSIEVRGSNDSALGEYTVLPVWKPGSPTEPPELSATSTGSYAGSCWGFKYIRIVATTSGTIVVDIYLTTVPMIPPIESNVPVCSVDLGIQVDDKAATVNHTSKASAGNFYRALVENLSGGTLYFMLFDASSLGIGATLVFAVRCPAGEETVIDPPSPIHCVNGITWNVNGTRGATGSHTPASDVNATMFSHSS